MLTYCTNIHPAESWSEIFSNVRRYVPEVKKKFCPDHSFPIGLRLSGRAVNEMDHAAIQSFQDWCLSEDCFVATINGFPYGEFHHVPIKEAVYLPDWRHPERLRYTQQLASLLSRWLPADRKGSISTVPIGFKSAISPEDLPQATTHLRKALEFLDDLAQKTGKEICLSLEPEPGCILETTSEVVRFFEQFNLPAHLRSFLRVCYDCCHQALQFESPSHSLQLLRKNNIKIGHVQVSSALSLADGDIGRLHRFSEPCYLHQTVGRGPDGGLCRFTDLDEALATPPRGIEEWRVHFHMPVFLEHLRECDTTQLFLKEILPLFDADVPLEVETYTWSVLPADLKTGSITDSIVREMQWTKAARKI